MDNGLKIIVQAEDALLETISLLLRNDFTNIEIEKSDDKYYIKATIRRNK